MVSEAVWVPVWSARGKGEGREGRGSRVILGKEEKSRRALVSPKEGSLKSRGRWVSNPVTVEKGLQ